jgi:hypothetical protein
MKRLPLTTLITICSQHHQHGEIVTEFNLSPILFKEFTIDGFNFKDNVVALVSERWQKRGDIYFLELEFGNQYTTTYTYKLK